ncbi:AMP-binding protein [Actinomarinicola tropica]|uniref:AMP-binding protein n=1 Tax=Actinomarinicola tropica TaxID=2789776 RepID=UPI00189ABB3D|nr:AMP-binding protein [Actinomarinicola tropica]
MTFHLADLFERVARAVPAREAVVWGEQRLTYAELDRRADRVAAALAEAEVHPGDMVAVGLRNRPEHLEVLLGALKAGAVPVNLNHRYRRAELEHLLADSGASLVVHEPEMAALVADATAVLPTLRRAIAVGPPYEAWLAATGGGPPQVARSGDDLYVLYTGGTTGRPKGVVWRHEDVFFAAMGGGIRGGEPIARPDDIVGSLAEVPHRALAASPLTHGTAQWFAFLTLFAGGTVVLSPDPTLEPVKLLDLVESESVSYVGLVGDAIAVPIADALAAHPDRWELDTLTLLLSGGAPLSAPTRRRLLELLPWVVVVDSYGTSETGGQASAVHAAGMAEPAGRPVFEPRVETAVLGPDLRPVEPGRGIVGRVARRGHIPLGYHRDPAATAATFPVVDGVRWALTGDQATVDERGRIVLLGRGASTINSGGEKIHPEEVEAALREHPSVYDAVVVGVPDERWGERVTAVVSTRFGPEVGAHDLADELAEHCRSRLADFKAPRSVVIVDAVPRLDSGKSDRSRARELAVRAAGVGR